MNGFAKDILLIDFEGTGIELAKSEPTQLGAVLLDKVTLEEKDHFLSYIAIERPEDFTKEAVAISGITAEMIADAPSRTDVVDSFIKQFGAEVFLASWNSSFDQAMLSLLLKSVDKDLFFYDYHYLDIWPIAYTYLCCRGRGDIIRSEATFNYFGQTARGQHDALDDCRRTAEVLRKIYFAKE